MNPTLARRIGRGSVLAYLGDAFSREDEGDDAEFYALRQTMRCPYCEEPLARWEVPEGPFQEWDNEFMHVCLNNDCPYLVGGRDVMARQGNPGFSYRLMYHPVQDRCLPTPIPNLRAMHEVKSLPRG